MRKIYLSLTGGLGNQLFQLAAASAIADGDSVEVEWVNSRPRLNSLGQAEVMDFALPKNIGFQKRHKFQKLNSKSIGYLLRMGIDPRRYEDFKIYKGTAAFLTSVINLSTFRRYIRIHVNQGVGYSTRRFPKTSKSLHLIGYFQTFRWIQGDTSEEFLNNLTVREKSPELLELINLASLESPLVVHMRFGDYRMEKSFGLLTENYYRNSIQELWKLGQFESIWVFSDEIEQAKNYLKDMEISEIKYISNVAKSSAQTLEAMRLGKGFVIGNSSFSWWAAASSFSENPKVIAPTPWFIGQEEPIDLIPENWMRRMGHVQS
jgi:hypothetical protein